MYKEKVILHVDINNFYASVAILMNPMLKGRAVIVCGDPDKRHGIVLAKSNEAKKAGIKTADTLWSAKQKVKDLIVVPPDFKKYSYYSRKVYEIYTKYTPEVESFGLDECWLDVTGCVKLFGDGLEIAKKIQNHIRKDTGLTVSIGVSFTKIFAKLGSDMKKPDAITVISKENYKKLAWPLDVSKMLFVGSKTQTKLNKIGIFTIGDLARANRNLLIKDFGKVGEKLHDYANGVEREKVKKYIEEHIPESVGNGTTTQEDITNFRDASSVIFALCEVIAYRMREYFLVGSSISINVRNKELRSFSRQTTLEVMTDSSHEIATTALQLLDKNYDFSQNLPLRTITISVSNLMSARDFTQISFFEEQKNKKRNLEKSVDNLRKKYGFSILKRGITMGTIFTCDAREVEDDFVPFH